MGTCMGMNSRRCACCHQPPARCSCKPASQFARAHSCQLCCHPHCHYICRCCSLSETRGGAYACAVPCWFPRVPRAVDVCRCLWKCACKTPATCLRPDPPAAPLGLGRITPSAGHRHGSKCIPFPSRCRRNCPNKDEVVTQNAFHDHLIVVIKWLTGASPCTAPCTARCMW